MTTQQQIDDPGQWRVGDVFEGEYDGHPFSGVVWDDSGDLMAGGITIRFRNGHKDKTVTGHVTRTVEPIPEPTVPWALVRFADDSTALRDEGADFPWLMSESATWTSWGDVVSTHGAPIAVSLPHWSDEVEPWRAAVRASLVVLSSRLSDAGAREVVENNLRALLAEGGEA